MTQQGSNMWLEKAATWAFNTGDLSGSTNGGLLAPEQAAAFLRIAIEASVIIGESRQEFSANPLFEVPRISFGDRIMKTASSTGGGEGERVAQSNRTKPDTGLVTLTTQLFKGEVPVSDETFEDNIERDQLADTVMSMVAEAVGRDLEEYAIKGRASQADNSDIAEFGILSGWVEQYLHKLPAGQKVNAAALTTYDDIFSAMIAALPARYRRNYAALRFYVPVAVADGYQQSLAARGTGLGDQAVTQMLASSLAFRGIPVKMVPMLSGTQTLTTEDTVTGEGETGGAFDYGNKIMLVDPSNQIVGWHRRVRIEKFRDPREGVTSFLPTVRYDTKLADPNYGVIAYGVSVS